MTSLLEQKQLLRQQMRSLRLADGASYQSAANQLADVFQSHVQLEETAVIASYYAFRGEIDPAPLTDCLRAHGHPIALPVIVGKDLPLTFRLYELGTKLVPNSMNIPEPDRSSPEADPDILLVPLLAFDRAGRRLGYGGGFYDRTLTLLRSRKKLMAIGVAFDFQEVPAVPTNPDDAPLDMIVTESRHIPRGT